MTSVKIAQTWRADQDLQGGTGLNIFLINSHEAVFQFLDSVMRRFLWKVRSLERSHPFPSIAEAAADTDADSSERFAEAIGREQLELSEG